MKNIGVLIFNTKIMVIIIVQILFFNVLQWEAAFQVVQCVVGGFYSVAIQNQDLTILYLQHLQKTDIVKYDY